MLGHNTAGTCYVYVKRRGSSFDDDDIPWKQVAWFGFRRPLMRAILESPYGERGAAGRVEEIPEAHGWQPCPTAVFLLVFFFLGGGLRKLLGAGWEIVGKNCGAISWGQWNWNV